MKARKVVDLSRQLRFEFESELINAKTYPKTGKRADYDKSELDLSRMLAPHPENTYLVRVTGESMIGKNIFDGDILVVDRSEKPSSGKIVIASLNGELTVKTYVEKEGEVLLVSANKKFVTRKIEDYIEFQIQGVVKYVIHDL